MQECLAASFQRKQEAVKHSCMKVHTKQENKHARTRNKRITPGGRMASNVLTPYMPMLEIVKFAPLYSFGLCNEHV